MRRTKGTGSVRPLGDGRYLLRWWERGERKSEVREAPTEEHAHRVMDCMMVQLAKDGSLGGAVTIADIGRVALDHYERKRGGRKLRPYRSRFKCHVADAPFAALRPDEVTPVALTRWIDELEILGLEPRTIRHCIYLVSLIFRYACERGKAKHNPVALVRKPAPGASRRDIILDAAGADKLADGAGIADEEARLIGLALLGTGVRPGELLGLHKDEDVNAWAARPHLVVRRSCRVAETTKGGKSRRVELFGLGLYAVRRWMKDIRPTLKVRGYETPANEPWAFPVPPGWLRTDGRLGAVLTAVGAPKGLHAHDLRGSCATHLLSGTWGEPWTIAEVASLLGDTIETVQTSYAHLVADALQQRAARTGSGNRWGNEIRALLDSSVISVGHEGLEPSANGLRDVGVVEDLRGVEGCNFPSVSRAARAYLEAAAAEQPIAHQRAVELAAVARTAAGRWLGLVDAIERGDEHWARRANRLADDVLGVDSVDSVANGNNQ